MLPLIVFLIIEMKLTIQRLLKAKRFDLKLLQLQQQLAAERDSTELSFTYKITIIFRKKYS